MQKAVPVVDKRTIKKGWNALINSLGLEKATRFIVGLERGEGDSVSELKALWKNKSVRAIHQEILEAKSKGKI